MKVTIDYDVNPVSDLQPGEIFMLHNDVYMVTISTVNDGSICCVDLKRGSFIYITPETQVVVINDGVLSIKI